MADRREFLAGLAGLAFATIAKEPTRPLFGWMPEGEPRNYPKASRWMSHLSGTGQGKQVLLWKAYDQVTGGYVAHNQLGNDCVGHATGLGVDVLASIQAYYGQASWRGKHSTEAIYAGSRIDIGVEKHGYRLSRIPLPGVVLRNGGTPCAWAIEWLKDYGALLRGKYGEYDLTRYNYDLVRAWVNRGVPESLEIASRRHPLLSSVYVDGGWEQACDLVANGFPIVIGSRQGFNNKYDDDGFVAPKGIWPHAMLLWGIDTKGVRHGGNLANSHGSRWITGPQHKLGTPPGSIWADARVIDKMLRLGWSYALSSFRGYPRRKLDYELS